MIKDVTSSASPLLVTHEMQFKPRTSRTASSSWTGCRRRRWQPVRNLRIRLPTRASHSFSIPNARSSKERMPEMTSQVQSRAVVSVFAVAGVAIAFATTPACRGRPHHQDRHRRRTEAATGAARSASSRRATSRMSGRAINAKLPQYKFVRRGRGRRHCPGDGPGDRQYDVATGGYYRAPARKAVPHSRRADRRPA